MHFGSQPQGITGYPQAQGQMPPPHSQMASVQQTQGNQFGAPPRQQFPPGKSGGGGQNKECFFIHKPAGCTNQQCRFYHPPGSKHRASQPDAGQSQPHMGPQPGTQPNFAQQPQQPGMGHQPMPNGFQGHQENPQTNPQQRQQRPCKFQDNCRDLQRGQCKFLHQNQPAGPGQQQFRPQVHQVKPQTNPSSAHPSRPKPEKSNNPCHAFQSGSCHRVHCHHKHVFCGLDLSKKAEFSITQDQQDQVVCTTMVNNGSQVLLVTLKLAILYELPSLKQLGSFPLKGQVNNVAAFDQIPGTFFFGEQDPTGFSFRMMTQSQEIHQQNAHSGMITGFECAAINNQIYLFSAGKDGKIKAWSPKVESFELFAEQTSQTEVLCLQMTSPTFLVAGLLDGSFAGWNLENNQFNVFKAHDFAVTSLHQHQTFLVSGDSSGVIKVFDTTSNFQVLLQSTINQGNPGGPPQPVAVTSLLVIEKPQIVGPLVVAGDNLGFITLISKEVQSGQILSVTMGAHADKKPNDVKKVLKLPSSQDLVSVGANGLTRLWTTQ